MKLGKIFLGILSISIVAASLASAGSQKFFSLNITTLDIQEELEQTQLSASYDKNTTPQSTNIDTPTKNDISPQAKPIREDEKPSVSVNKITNGEPLNILIIGSDTREGDNEKYGDPEKITGARADSTILVNINGTRDEATIISIPRDLIVNIPECSNPTTQNVVAPREARFNEAYALGGIGCTVKTTSQLFNDLPINHVMVIDFSGFTKIIDTIGGLNICLNEPLKDKKSKLNLPAGTQLINGKQALSLARARYSISDGSDLSRIGRQQAIAKQIFSEIKKQNLGSNPITLYAVAQDFLSSLAVDKNLAQAANFANLMFTALDINEKNITYMTLPWLPRGDQATLSIDEEKLDELIVSLNTPKEKKSPYPSFLSPDRISEKIEAKNKEKLSKENKEQETKKKLLCDEPLF